MKRFLALGDAFARSSSWKDFALTKFCLCAMGILIGICIPEAYHGIAAAIAAAVFAVTYIPLMIKIFKAAKGMQKKQ